MTIAFILILLLISATLSVLLINTRKRAKTVQTDLDDKTSECEDLKTKYLPIIKIEHELDIKQSRLQDFDNRIITREAQYTALSIELKSEYQQKRSTYESLLKEISVLEESLDSISYGLYKPQYNYTTSQRYKDEIERVILRQKNLIKDNKACACNVEWNVRGSLQEGAKMTAQLSKLMLRAFNGECDAAISRVKWNNIANMEARIDKSYDAINKLGSSYQITITEPYKKLKLEELHLAYELQEKMYNEKEEQRMIREQMKEEERANREFEKAQKDAEDEESRYQKALDKARLELGKAKENEIGSLNTKITELEDKLKNAHAAKERAISMAQMTKQGHVYVISNIGAFGENVYKIGMTRRLEPLDRVRELGDASVPFQFDVHAMIHSENAPALENMLHKKFDHKRLNLVNGRREFFNISIDEIENAVNEFGAEAHWTQLAEAKEYKESVSIRSAKNSISPNELIEVELNKFPEFI